MRRLLMAVAWTLLATDLSLLLETAVTNVGVHAHARPFPCMATAIALSSVLTGALVYMASGYRRLAVAALGPFLGHLLVIQAVFREDPVSWHWYGVFPYLAAESVAPAALGLAGAAAVAGVAWLRRRLAARAGSSSRSQDRPA